MSDVGDVSDVSGGGLAGDPAPVAAVVLCGGTSRRFGGVDKTAQTLGSGTVLDSLLDALPPDWPVTCVGVPRPTVRPVSWTREDPPLGGPVAGIAAGLGTVEAPIVVVVAGDQPLAGAGARRVAQELAQAPADVDVAAPLARDGRPAMLLAAYRRGPLAAALRGPVRDVGVYRTFAGLRVRTIDLPPEQVWDVDTREDLERLRDQV